MHSENRLQLPEVWLTLFPLQFTRKCAVEDQSAFEVVKRDKEVTNNP